MQDQELKFILINNSLLEIVLLVEHKVVDAHLDSDFFVKMISLIKGK